MPMDTECSPDEREPLAEELQNFREVAAFLNPSPGEVPRLEGIDIAALSLPLSANVGGDHVLFIDFDRRYDLDSRIAQATQAGNAAIADKLDALRRRAGVLVADVSGHRMTDALIAAMLHQAFLLGAIYELDMFGEITTRLFEHINTRFHRTTAINKYFTMIYGEISSDGKFRFLSAGHRPPAVFSREYGRFVRISPERLVSFPPVGLFPSSTDRDAPSLEGYKKKRYKVNEIDLLAAGDILLLYTDGLSEHAGGSYFPGRMERLLSESRDATAAEICERVKADLPEWGAAEDDVSLAVIRKLA